MSWKSLGFKSYKEYLLSYLWESKKELMLDLFEKCYSCNSTKNLQVHHKNYERCGNEGIRDLVVLCKKCHGDEHGV